MRATRQLFLLLALAGMLGLLLPAAPASAALIPRAAGSYYPLTPTRLVDTRTGFGAAKRPIGAGQTIPVSVADRGGVPRVAPREEAEAGSVVVNVTVTGATATHGFLTLYKSTRSRPGITSLSYGRGRTTTTTVTVALGTDGKIKIYNSAGSVDVIVDVIGYYGSGINPSVLRSQSSLTFLPLEPHRLVDSRTDGSGPLLSRQVVRTGVSVSGRYGVTYTVQALAVNITATGATGSGRLTAWKGSGPLPATASVSFSRSTTVSNLTIVPVTRCRSCAAPSGSISVINVSSASVQVIIDVVGVYLSRGPGFYYLPLAPVRMTDSRSGLNGATIGSKQTQVLPAPAPTARPYTGALAGSLTVVDPTATTHLAIGPGLRNPYRADGTPSSLSAPQGRTVTNGIAVGLVVDTTTRDSAFTLSNSAGRTDYLIDVVGRFDTNLRSPSRADLDGLRVAASVPQRATLGG